MPVVRPRARVRPRAVRAARVRRCRGAGRGSSPPAADASRPSGQARSHPKAASVSTARTGRRRNPAGCRVIEEGSGAWAARPGARRSVRLTRQPIECMMISVARWTPARPWATRVEPVGAPGYAGWDWPWAVAVLRRCRSIGTTHPSVPSRRPCPVELRRRRRFTRYNPGEHVERMQIQLTARRALSPVARGQIEGGRTRV